MGEVRSALQWYFELINQASGNGKWSHEITSANFQHVLQS